MARNKIGERKATILLTGILQSLDFYKSLLFQGLPSAPIVLSGELSASLTSYILSWHTHSFTDIAKYNILYRKYPVGSVLSGGVDNTAVFVLGWSDSLCMG